ncbi:50S ribosomal protein L6 [Candidatus Finniella inopinata]|uniref:50S ribosomal protein L6 n=1 Tax=Candidatus Finniella inopinata TaxID=1696036 RepID=A0A4Q7DH64_9PROT|nr:50S ribosomal protein L6 [Candidatus Finniella inopinata]RZI46261.1 50S ribosomal protein L6 [Candidatus Finniella inopinata]
MSRVGKSEIVVPNSVTWSQAGQTLSFKGKLGAGEYSLPEVILLEKTDNGIKLVPANEQTSTRRIWGTTQRNVQNIVKGIDNGFTLNIDLVGVGYKAAVAGSKLTMQLGFSHDVVFDIPSDLTIKCEKPTSIAITGASKQRVGQIGAVLCSHRPPEPYKGKGMIRQNEFVVRKEGKKK